MEEVNIDKRLDTLSFTEVMAIFNDSELYARFIDLECAHRGVSLLPVHPGEKPVQVKHEEDLTLHKVGSWFFKSNNEALAILSLIEKAEPCSIATKAGKQVITVMEKDSYYWPSIESRSCFSKEKFASIKVSASHDKEVLEDWQELKKDYDRALTDRSDVIDLFKERLHHGKEIGRGVDKIQTDFVRYLDLAHMDYKIAMNFLVDSRKGDGIELVGDDLFYVCSEGQKHEAINREQYKEDSMHKLLGVPDAEE